MNLVLYAPPYRIGSSVGGSHVHLTEIIERLSRNHDVTVVCQSASGFDETPVDIREVTVIDMPVIRRLSLTIHPLLILILLLASRETDIIYARNNYHSVVSRIASALFSTTHVVEVNGFAPEEQDINPSDSVRELIAFSVWRFVEWSFKYSDHIVAVTEDIKQTLVDKYDAPEGKITVINNGADTELFRPLDRNECKDRLDLESDVRYLCFVGRLTKWQGVKYVIAALPMIVEQDDSIHLLIVGDGPKRKALEKEAVDVGVDERVHFVGRVPHQNVPYYIGASNLCLVYKKPLESGYSPLKLYEYLACGRPVVASDVTGFRFLDDISAGTTAQPKNPDALAEAIEAVLNADEDLGMNGREYVVENHSWDQVADQIAEIGEGELSNNP